MFLLVYDLVDDIFYFFVLSEFFSICIWVDNVLLIFKGVVFIVELVENVVFIWLYLIIFVVFN